MKTQSSVSEFPEEVLNRPIAYIVDGDRQFLNAIEKDQYEWGINLITESDPVKAKEKLSSGDFDPRIVIVSDIFPTSKIRGYDLIEAIKNRKNSLGTIYGLFVETEDLKVRVEALRKDISLILHKPVSAELLLKTMKESLQYNAAQGLKGLIIDRDVNSKKSMTQSLMEIGMEIKTLPDCSDLLQTLQNLLPQVLLMSVSASSYQENVDILKALRLDPRYQNMFIIAILDAHDTSIVGAFTAITDGILYHPLEKKVLQSKILQIAKRYIALQENIERDVITGLPSKNAFHEYLYQHLVHADKEKAGVFLALMEIEYGNEGSMGQNGGISEETLANFSNLILRDLNERGFCAFLEKNRFAFISEPTNLNSVQGTLENFLRFARRELISVNGNSNITLNCGMTSVPTKYVHMDSVIKSAEEALKLSKKEKKEQPVRIATYAIDGEKTAKSQSVVLIDPDKEIVEILTSALKLQGYSVHPYSTGKSFEDDFFINHVAPPSLVITERLLPDMDGIELVRSINNKYPAKVPLIFLTSLSSEKDIFDGIKAGALDYIVKPFNLNILLQKSITILS